MRMRKEYLTHFHWVAETNRLAFESGRKLLVRPAFVDGYLVRNHMEWVAEPDCRSIFRKFTDWALGKCRKRRVELLIEWVSLRPGGIVHQNVSATVLVRDFEMWLSRVFV